MQIYIICAKQKYIHHAIWQTRTTDRYSNEMVKLSGGEANEEENRREISLPPLRRNGTVFASNGISACRGGGRDPKVGSEPANESGIRGGEGEGKEGGGRRAVIACWVIYLVILADRPRARSTRRSRGLLTRGGQPPALLEIKNSLYYTSHSTLSRFDPSARPPPHSPSSRHLTRPLFSPPHFTSRASLSSILIIFRRSPTAPRSRGPT